MDEVRFRMWLTDEGVKPKVISDTISRLKRLENELNRCDIDDEYRIDKCERIYSALANNGNNDVMRNFPKTKLPIGKYYMSTFRYALKKYIEFVRTQALNDT